MYFNVPEAAYYLGYALPASLYRLLKADLLKDYVEMLEGQVYYGWVLRVNLPRLQKGLEH